MLGSHSKASPEISSFSQIASHRARLTAAQPTPSSKQPTLSKEVWLPSGTGGKHRSAKQSPRHGRAPPTPAGREPSPPPPPEEPDVDETSNRLERLEAAFGRTEVLIDGLSDDFARWVTVACAQQVALDAALERCRSSLS